MERKGRELLKDRNLVGKEGTGQAGLERKKGGGDYYRDRRQAYGQRSHDRVDLIERIKT